PSIVLSKADENCGGSDGSATATVSGGTAPYSYYWNTNPAQSTPNITGLTAGNYLITITDDAGCSVDTSVPIIDILPPVIDTLVNNILCNGTATGATTLNVSGGAPPYTYLWSQGATTQNLSNLTVGTYSVYVTGDNGCMDSVSVTITEPPALSLSTTVNDANCGNSDGNIEVNVVGGTSPYLYAWNTTPVQTTAVAVNIPSGLYEITVTDENGCTETATASVNDTGLPTLTLTYSEVTCNGGNDGTATVSAIGGSVPYTYSWNTSPVQTSSTANNLTAGVYSVSVSSADGCITITYITISEPVAITLSSTVIDEICGNSNGVATVTASGGTSPYTYAWSSTAVLTTPTTAVGLTAGTYSVTVTDNVNCVNSINFTVNNVPAATPNFTYSNSCLNTPVAFTNTSINATNWLWEMGDGTLSSLPEPVYTFPAAGTYPVKLTIIDANGCTDSITQNIIIHPLSLVSFGDSTTGCSPLTVNYVNNSSPVAGSTYFWDLGNNITSQLHSPNSTYINETQNLTSHNISLKVVSSYGCADSLTKNNFINIFPNPQAVFTMDPGVTEITTPSVNFFNYSINDTERLWTFGDGNTSSVSSPVHTYKDSGTYNVCLEITNSYGCKDSICNTVFISPVFTLYIPNAFTPDNDGINDYFKSYGENIIEYEMLIFNRWGEEIFSTNNISPGWDGRIMNNSIPVQQGVYAYIIMCKDVFNKTHTYYGHVTLIK
ncbi:MAG: PKD domain-containing protein, partial [Bacteroidota bacterium]|nr:PKD domain-containing protein [Bacteroidota bacterium]